MTYTPFVKVIKTDNNIYAYDVNSACILRITPYIGEILENYAYYSGLGDSADEIYQQVLEFIMKEQAKEELFLPVERQVIQPNVSPSDVTEDTLAPCSHLILNVTEECNFGCNYCVYSGAYSGHRTHSQKTMTLDTAKKAVDLLAKNKDEIDERIILGFYGGEPLIRFEFIKNIVQYAKECFGDHPCLFSITTNGSLLTEEIIHFLIANNFAITISLDGPAEIHDRNRRLLDDSGSYQLVTDNISLLRNTAGERYFRDFVSFSCVITPPYDFQYLNDFFSGYDAMVRISTVDYNPDFYKNDDLHMATGWEALAANMKQYCLDGKQKKDFISDGLSLPYDLFFRQLKKIHRIVRRQLTPGNNRAMGLCQPGLKRAFVSCDGDIYVCERTEGNTNMLIGSVSEGIRKDKVIRILEDISYLDYSKCQSCWTRAFCNICFAHLSENNEYSMEKWEFNCKNIRHNYEYMLRLYCEIMESDDTALDFLIN